MRKKLTKTGNSLALVLDKPLLDRARIDANMPLEVSTDGDVIVITPVRDRRRTARLKRLVAEAYRQYGDRTPRGPDRAIRRAAGHQGPRPPAVRPGNALRDL